MFDFNVEEWKKFGFDESEAKDWNSMGFDIESAVKWRDYGFNEREAYDWNRVYGFAVLDAMEWSGLKLTANMARDWVDVGFLPSDVQFVYERGFDFEDVVKELNNGHSKEETLDILLKERDI